MECADCGLRGGEHSRTCPVRVDALEARIAELEKTAHPPIAQTRIEARLTGIEKRMARRGRVGIRYT